jgi:hypothetical protein
MNSKKHIKFNIMAFALLLSYILIPIVAAEIIEERDQTYLIDQIGERWDISQAVSIGFKPSRFEFGIGRNAFRPLSESDWSNSVGNSKRNFRIIGIADGDEAHAYSVSKLARHEIANTMLDSDPIAVGY